MSNSSSQQSARLVVDGARPGAYGQNGYPAAPADATNRREPGKSLARGARHRELIDASFDRAEAYGRLGDVERALEWMDRAAVLCGGLPPAYRVKRARWARAAARRPRPGAGDWRDRGGGTGQGALGL